MSARKNAGDGFTLVEVALAIGVVAFAVVTIFSLFSASYRVSGDLADQAEALSVVQALPAYLQAAGFSVVYSEVKGGTASDIYAYTAGDRVIIDTAGAPDMSGTAVAARTGRLFNILLSPSPNASLALTASSTALSYLPAGSGSSTALLPPESDYADPYLPLNVKIYPVPTIPAPSSLITQGRPVLNYDTVLSR